MNQGRIWCVVKPTVGLPLFLGSVALTSLAVHTAVLNNTPWMANFFSWQRHGCHSRSQYQGNIARGVEDGRRQGRLRSEYHSGGGRQLVVRYQGGSASRRPRFGWPSPDGEVIALQPWCEPEARGARSPGLRHSSEKPKSANRKPDSGNCGSLPS